MIETLMCSAALALGSVVSVTRPGTLPASAMLSDPQRPVIVHVVSRDRTITVKSSKDGLLYSLTGTDGKVLVADAMPQKFAELHPDLYRNVRQYIAVKNDDSAATPALATAAD